MSTLRMQWAVALIAAAVLAGCATRPVNPPLRAVDADRGYSFPVRQKHFKAQENLVVLAFSGGGTRAAAFSYGVLEFLRDTKVAGPNGATMRLLDSVDVITGVSGGSFTALAYGLYGEKLFADYEQRFLKRNVQSELITRALSPTHWFDLASPNWGRSEVAAELYDEILFHGATFGDLNRGRGPFIIASATDLSSGARFPFTQSIFDVICSDLDAVPLSRAAAASSAVPVVLSPVTMNNYGGTCNFDLPAWSKNFVTSADPPRPAARAIKELKEAQAFGDGARRPYLHLVDGGVSDNVGMRSVLDVMQLLEAFNRAGIATPLDHVRRIVVLVVNSLSSPPVKWDESETPPGAVEVLVKATGVPIDHYSYEAVELLKDMSARWRTVRELRSLAGCSEKASPVCAELLGPNAEIYAIDVSFAQLPDPAERDYLNRQPTTFFLPDEAVDRLRAAGGKIILASPEFQRVLRDLGATVVPTPAVPTPAKAGSP